MRKLVLLLHTISHLRGQQIFFQVYYRLYKPSWKEKSIRMSGDVHRWFTLPIKKEKCWDGKAFSFLNIISPFCSWADTRNGMLWAYNLNYMDWLYQNDLGTEEGSFWIEQFIKSIPENHVGLDPYPIALRGLNWIKFMTLNPINPDVLERWNNSLYSQYKLLGKKLEYHLSGNHLLEDAYSLFVASIYFNDLQMYKRASRLLLKELRQQILTDGAHYEQSPMYHCILLDRLLDCYNFSIGNECFIDQEEINLQLREYAEKMLGHLASITYDDGTIPLLNDSANGIAPTPQMLFDYARRLGLKWASIPLRECGYRKLQSQLMEVVMDVGNIMATYQPGHTHADVFNYELRISGMPVIVDTGISTYNKTERRQYERSTIAHNTISINQKDVYEVWGGFRVGKRAKVEILNENDKRIEAVHNGFGDQCRRIFSINDTTFQIEDYVKGKACSYIHLSPHEKVEQVKDAELLTTHSRISIKNAVCVQIQKEKVSTEYNKFETTAVIVIEFKDHLFYSVTTR